MKTKTLGQIAYESTSQGGRQNFGPWAKAPQIVRDVHEEMASAVINEHLRRAHIRILQMFRESMRGYTLAQRAELTEKGRKVIEAAAYKALGRTRKRPARKLTRRTAD